jgi:glycosyltransferase involved in cell wall biosynthesis
MYSIIIPAHNEEEYIMSALVDLYKQNFPKNLYEVVIVDNASIDLTVCKIWDFAISHPLMNLRLVHENRLGVSRAKNSGARYSKFETLIFLDADNNVEYDFLSKVYFLTTQRRASVATLKTMPNKYSFKEFIFFFILEIIKVIQLKPFGKVFVTRTVFNQVGGFNSEITLGENVDFLSRAKKFAIKNKLFFTHISISTIKCSLRRFEKKGFLQVITPWLIAYLGFYKLKYPTMSEI